MFRTRQQVKKKVNKYVQFFGEPITVTGPARKWTNVSGKSSKCSERCQVYCVLFTIKGLKQLLVSPISVWMEERVIKTKPQKKKKGTT